MLAFTAPSEAELTVDGLLPPDCEERIRYCRWFHESVFNGLLDPELMLYFEEAWFTLNVYVNS